MRYAGISLALAILGLSYNSQASAQSPATTPNQNATQTQGTEIEVLRAAIDELRTDYEARISELEQRLAVAEQNAQQASALAQQGAAASAPTTSRASSGEPSSAFNPAIGVIFTGTAWNYDGGDPEQEIPGFPLGGHAHPIPQGLALGETEINISANVDDKFTAWLTLPVAIEDGDAEVEIEEAWVETTALANGFSARMGRFYSGIGYLNSKHLHSWDFADQPLPYQAFLGNQYGDDGVQLRWVAPTPWYLELGAEALRGDAYPAAGADHSGVGSYSLFANLGGDVGTDHSWLAGLSYLNASSIDRPSGEEDDPLLFTGDSDLAIAQFVWKWAPNGNWKEKNLIIQSEYLWRDEQGDYTLPGELPLAYDNKQRGWYLQAIYQPFPRWRFGARVDGLSSDNPGAQFDGTPLDPGNDDPMRYSLMGDWSNSEFSRLRLQYVLDQSGLEDIHQLGLQYIYSIGAHGAHSF